MEGANTFGDKLDNPNLMKTRKLHLNHSLCVCVYVRKRMRWGEMEKDI
jgi:hypothetical protein